MPAVVSQLSIFLYLVTWQIYTNQCPLSQASDYTGTCGLFDAVVKTYDFIIIGAGTAGTVLANRLMYSNAFNVLVIEAGMPPSNYSEMPLTHMHMRHQVSAHDWYFKTQPGDYCQGYPDGCIIHQGRGIGGSSLISNMMQYEGNAEDYDDWELPLWSWDEVSQNLDKVNNLFNPATKGYMEVTTPESDHPSRDLTLEAAMVLNLTTSYLPGARMGYHNIPVYVKGSRRMNVAKGYIKPIKSMPKLCVLYNLRASKILIDPLTKVASGVEVVTQFNLKFNLTASREVILSAGTINSPKLLMLSGIGPLDHLVDMNIPVILPLEGVGKNLHDQMEFPLHIQLPAEYNFTVDLLTGVDEFCENSTGPLGDLKDYNFVGYINTNLDTNLTIPEMYPDMAITTILFQTNDTVLLPIMLLCHRYNVLTEWFVKSKNLFSPMLIMQPTLLKPESRGYLLLNTTNIDDQPLIYPNFLDLNTSDPWVLMDGIDHIKALMNTTAFQDLTLLDVTAPDCLPYDYDTFEYWACTLINLARPLGNAVGTCRMGLSHVDGSVVTQRMKVHGMPNLRVVDASVVPKITAGDMVTRNILIAELAAEYILDDIFFG